MSLSLLLDENISQVIAEQVRLKRSDIAVLSIHHWHEGAYLSVPDEVLLAAAYAEGLTLVTYDTQILSELSYIFEEEITFGGLIFVDAKTIASSDFGSLTRAIVHLWETQHVLDWSNRLMYLPARRHSYRGVCQSARKTDRRRSRQTAADPGYEQQEVR